MSNKSNRFRITQNIHAAKTFARALVVLCAVAGASVVYAQTTSPAAKSQESKGPLSIQLTQAKVVNESQREVLVDAAKVKPGEVIEYRARYTNTGKQPITRMTATLPLAAGLELLPQSTHPAQPAALAATDDGVYAPMPLMRKVAGKSQKEPVPYSEYRSLRWNVGQLGAGSTFEVVARARVGTGTDAQPVSVSSVSKPTEATAKP